MYVALIVLSQFSVYMQGGQFLFSICDLYEILKGVIQWIANKL